MTLHGNRLLGRRSEARGLSGSAVSSLNATLGARQRKDPQRDVATPKRRQTAPALIRRGRRGDRAAMRPTEPTRLDIYIVAIGGTGMAPLACLLQEQGHRVRGTDGPLYPPMSTLLERAGRRPLVVTGTHGKTTTTAMAAWVYSQCGADPGYLIGGVPHDLPGSFAAGGEL